MNTLVHWHEARLAALAFLSVYLILGLVLLRREGQFLRSLKPGERWRYIVQDVLLQLCVLAILLPTVLSPTPQLWAFYLIFGAFLVLWAVVIWVAASRYSYTWRLLSQSRYRGPGSSGEGKGGSTKTVPREENKRDDD